ncbi:MAG: Alpha/beta hydrolase [Chloroflexota bacterium]|nr:Alpha/beta hydrolase [Chloroflexota bacterium]
MTSWQSGDIEINKLKLHYTRTGGDKPPVVLAHGFSDDGLCWTPVAKRLEADYDVVMVDARGHGRSDAPKSGYGSLEHAGDVAGVSAALGLKRPAVLGHSMGAATALALAGTYPDLVRAILLEDPPAWWMPPPDGKPIRRRGRFGDWIIDLKRKTREEMIAQAHAQSPTWSEAELGPWADSKLRLSFRVLNRGKSAPVDWPATVGRITCPALLITADPEKGGLVTPEAAAALRAFVPQTRVAHIGGAGHSIRREQFARYMEVVSSFLTETSN